MVKKNHPKKSPLPVYKAGVMQLILMMIIKPSLCEYLYDVVGVDGGDGKKK